MTNVEVAWILNDIADLLELAETNSFKIRAYRKAAKNILRLDRSLQELYKNGKLRDIPGIGTNLACKIQEILETGKCSYLEKLQQQVPAGLREMLAIPGLGPKSVRTIYEHLGIATLEQLAKAAEAKKIRNLPGMGSKTELSILRGVELVKKNARDYPLGIALPVAQSFTSQLSGLPEVERIEIAGSLRRGKEVVGDVDLVAVSLQPEKVMDVFVKHPQVKEVLVYGTTKSSVLTWLGVQVDLRVVPRESFHTAWHHFTGSKEHNVRLRELARQKGLKVNEYGIFQGDDPLEVNSEIDICHFLDMDYIPPELREDTGEIEAALTGTVPVLLKPGDIRGDLHIHTLWSDGICDIGDMVEGARRRGYQYIAVTDHSRSLAIAGGLSEEKLERQHAEVRQLDQELSNFKLFTGIEVDILPDGKLDYPDEVLAQADVVIASVHSRFRQDRDTMTSRVEQAIKNPHVDILAHPTGRIIGRRKPYDLDLERIFEVAEKTGTALELNASPDRLDLKDTHVRQAKERGIPIAINTDAHDVMRLAEMKFGVITGRRGWLEKDDVINTFSLCRLQKWLAKEKG